jgi:UDP-N-acetylglucosamine 2-epimerase (non-hydrolysing)
MLKTMFVFGTRPEAIKLAPVIQGMLERPKSFEAMVCVTAQHREMLDQALTFFGLPVHYDLNVMRPNQNLNTVAARILEQLGDVIRDERPDIVCVQGDTVSTLMGALAAFYSQARVMHVEAGLRSGRKDAPFPEEINRVLTSHITDFHFAPTEAARAHLATEGITSNVWVTGNTAIDALHLGLARIGAGGAQDLRSIGPLDPDRRLVLVTSHRRESFGEPFARILRAIGRIASNFPDVQVLFPVHRNPNVQRVARRDLSGISNVVLQALRACTIVITDSGGLQEEAPALGKPVLVLRDVTERMEGVRAGTAKLVGTDDVKIVAAAETLLTDARAYSQMAQAVNPYGDGRATERIIAALLAMLGELPSS